MAQLISILIMFILYQLSMSHRPDQQQQIVVAPEYATPPKSLGIVQPAALPVPLAIVQPAPSIPQILPAILLPADTYIEPPSEYPLPSCYTNEYGFMCCNKRLEKLLEKVYKNATDGPYSTCNVNRIAIDIQRAAQDMFGVSFESIVGTGDFASKTHFRDDLSCKIEMEGKYLFAYGSPEPYALNEPNTPLDKTEFDRL